MISTALHEVSDGGGVVGRVDDCKCSGEGSPALLQTVLERQGAHKSERGVARLLTCSEITRVYIVEMSTPI